MSHEDATFADGVEAVRAVPSRRRLATLAGVALGLLLAQLHWLGLVAGGALVALPQPSLGRGIAAGLGFGVLAWVAFLATLWWAGAAGLYPAMGDLAVVVAAVSLACGLLGGLARGFL